MQTCHFLHQNRRAHIRKEGISARQQEIAESRDSLASQELQGSRHGENQSLEVGTNFDWQMLPEAPTSDSHQSNQEATSHTPESMVSKEETWEADKETERFFTSLAFSRVMEVTSGSTAQEKGKRRYDSTGSACDWAREGTRAQSGPPGI